MKVRVSFTDNFTVTLNDGRTISTSPMVIGYHMEFFKKPPYSEKALALARSRCWFVTRCIHLRPCLPFFLFGNLEVLEVRNSNASATMAQE
jgi:hypothetical protein